MVWPWLSAKATSLTSTARRRNSWTLSPTARVLELELLALLGAEGYKTLERIEIDRRRREKALNGISRKEGLK